MDHRDIDRIRKRVRAAVKTWTAKGKRIVRRSWGSKDCGCPMAAVICTRKGWDELPPEYGVVNSEYEAAEILDISREAVHDFIIGFDMGLRDNPMQNLGAQIGKEVFG